MDKLDNQYLIILTGPTAVGKTDLSILLAEKYNAEIFSCDSRQLYQEMKIGTARPEDEILGKVRHHFINEVSIKNHINVGDYLKAFDERIEQYFHEKNVAILTGGTGLYISAILNGLNDFPDVPDHIIDDLEHDLKEKGLAFLQEELQAQDPVYAASSDIQNPVRVIRALSVIRSSDKPFSDFLNLKVERNLSYIPIKICLERERSELYTRINHRVDIMLDSGLEAEVKSLYPLRDLKALSTVGYSEFFRYFDGEIDYEEAVRLIKRNSRRYAKRQMTWFRNQEDFTYFHPEEQEKIMDYITDFIKSAEPSR